MKMLLPTACVVILMNSCAYQEAPDTKWQLTIHRLRIIENTIKERYSSGTDIFAIKSVRDLFDNLDRDEAADLLVDGWGLPWELVKYQGKGTTVVMVCSQGRLAKNTEFPNSPLLRIAKNASNELAADIMIPKSAQK